MKKLTFYILILLVICFISCSRPFYYVLYNNSKKDLTIYYDKEIWLLKNQEKIEFEAPNLLTNFIIKGDSKIWKYKPTYNRALEYKSLPWEYLKLGKISGKKIKGRIYFLQIESNGYIYIVKPGTKMPTTVLPPQPEDYPLKPINN